MIDSSPTSAEVDLDGCPPWCAVDHAHLGGEDADVHAGVPLEVGDDVTARLVKDDAEDSAYVLLGDDERSLSETRELGAALIALAEQGGCPPHAAPGTPPRDRGPAAS